MLVFTIKAEKSEKKYCDNIVIYAPIESPSRFDWKNFILKIFGSDSDEKNRKTGQKYEFPIIWTELLQNRNGNSK